MLIDRTYFVGEINIPNTNGANGDVLDLFIDKYEAEFLQKALGYELYKEFKNGLVQDPVAQKWRDLLEGAEYTFNSRLHKWNGLISLPLGTLNAIDAENTITVIVGRGQQYDPASGTNTTVIPAQLVGKDFVLEQRLIGRLRSDEYSIEGNELTLIGSQFSQGDTYFFKSPTLELSESTGLIKRSPIANYIYYWYCRDAHTQTASMGEKKSQTEYASDANPGLKMVRAWNEMVDALKYMREFLYANKDAYNYEPCFSEVFYPINVFNI